MTMKQDVLACLQQARDYLSGEQIAQALDISRAAVWKWIDALRREGYEIESRSGRGYRLLSTPDVMTQAAVLAQLGRHPWAGQVTVLPTVDSTNTALKRINMALRWLVRCDGIVDLGVWTEIKPSQLYIPLDVHVGDTARALGLVTRRANDKRTVVELTKVLRKMRPDDPVIYDFALFGIGIGDKYLHPTIE